MIKKILIGLFALISYLNLDAQCTSQRVTNPTFSPLTGWTKTANARPVNPGIAFNIDNSTDNIYQDLTDVNPLGNQSPVINMCIGTYDALPLGPNNSGWARLELWYNGVNYVNMINQAGTANQYAYIEYLNSATGSLASGNSLIKNTSGIDACLNNIVVTLPNNVSNNGRLEFRYYTQQDNPPHNGNTQADDDFFIGSVTLTRTLPTPATPTISTTAASCSAAGTAKISNYNASYTYTFTPAGPTVGAGGVISGMTVGTNYTVQASLGGCQSVSSSSFSITGMVSTPAQLSVTAGGPTTFCTGGSVQLTATYNTTGAYQWYNNGIAIPGAIFYQYTATTTGTYTVTRELGGCTSLASAGVNVTVNNCTQPDFGNCSARMFFDTTTNPAGSPWISTLYEVKYTSLPFTYTSLGSSQNSANLARNAIGYNPLDNYLYGIEWDGGTGNELIRIGSDGSSVNLGTIAGLPVGNYSSGGTSPNGNFYVKAGNSGNTIYEINIAARTSTALTLSKSIDIADLAWYNGLLYAVDLASPSTLVNINVTNGNVTDIGPTGAAWPIALWSFGNALYSTNGTTGMYIIDPITGVSTKIGSTPSTNGGDGASCPTALIKLDTDLSVTKTNTPASGANDQANDTYIPGEIRKYTVVVSNSATGFGVQNMTVSDPVLAGINAATVSWKCTPTSGGAVCGAATGTGALNDTGLDLPPGAVATYEVTMTIPTTFTGALTNTVTITPPNNINDTNAANNTATDTDLVNNSTFSCNSNFYLSQYPAGGPTTLYTLNNNTNPFTITSVGTSPAGYIVNGIGYNTVDKYMYGIYSVTAGDNRLIKIDATGNMTDLGTINTLPNTGYNNGTFDNAGNLYTSRYGTDKFYKINITTKVATEIVLSRTIQVNDIVYDQSTGKFFGYEGTAGTDRLVSINLTSATAGTVTNLPTSNLPAGSTFGAMYIDSNGDIFGNEDNTGSGFYQFDKTTGTAVKISTSIKAFGNDGANCPDAVITFPADLSVTKTDGKTSYIPGTTNTYTIVVSNTSGPYGVLGATVSDLLPAGIPAANMSYSVPVLAGGATTSITGPQTGALNDVVGLPVGATITYTVTINVPVTYTGNLTNTVTVTPPANSTDPTPGNNTATDMDTNICSGGADSDGDGISDTCDLDDDNDGILDTDECGAANRIARGDFFNLPSSPGLMNAAQFAVASSNNWTLTATATGVYWTNNAGFGNGVYFRQDNETQSLTQPLTGIFKSFQNTGPQLMISKFEAANGIGGVGTPLQRGRSSTFTISYAGTEYVRIVTADGVNSNATLTYSNGASGNISIILVDTAFNNWVITLPTNVPNTGNLVIGFISGSGDNNGGADDFLIESLVINSCKDTDNDGIPDYLDLDSDNDGCLDAIEGGASFTAANLVNAGGTVTVGTGSPAPNQNLGNTVGNTATTMGVPVIAGTGQSVGDSQNAAVSSQCMTYCVKPGDFTSGGIPTKVGITNQRKLEGWPESVPNGHITLESKDKGFVITRVPHVSTTPDLINDSVKDPKEGMIVYDIQDKCVKLYNGSSWNCIQRSCNEVRAEN